jgi:hypothetical protein
VKSVLSVVRGRALLDVIGLLLVVLGLGVVLAALVSLAVGVGAGLVSGGVACLLLSRAAEG